MIIKHAHINDVIGYLVHYSGITLDFIFTRIYIINWAKRLIKNTIMILIKTLEAHHEQTRFNYKSFGGKVECTFYTVSNDFNHTCYDIYDQHDFFTPKL